MISSRVSISGAMSDLLKKHKEFDVSDILIHKLIHPEGEENTSMYKNNHNKKKKGTSYPGPC